MCVQPILVTHRSFNFKYTMETCTCPADHGDGSGGHHGGPGAIMAAIWLPYEFHMNSIFIWQPYEKLFPESIMD